MSGNKLKLTESLEDESGIEIKFIGLQQGEKIHEELFIDESISPTEHPMIMKAQEDFCSWKKIEEILAALKTQNSSEKDDLRQLLLEFSTKKNTNN